MEPEKGFFRRGEYAGTMSIYVSQNGQISELTGAGNKPNLVYGTRVFERPDEPNDIRNIERAMTLIRFNTPKELRGRIYSIVYEPSNIQWGEDRVAISLETTPELIDFFDGCRFREPSLMGRYLGGFYEKFFGKPNDNEIYWREFNELFHGVGMDRAGITPRQWDELQDSMREAEKGSEEFWELYRTQEEWHEKIVAQIRPEEFPEPVDRRVRGLDDILMNIPISPLVPQQ